MKLVDVLNEELSKVLGANHNWMEVITRAVNSKASRFSNNGIIDDVITDVSGDIILQAKDGKLSIAVIRAKQSSTTEDELLLKLKAMLSSAAMFRTRDAMKSTYNRPLRASQFSQMGDDEGDFAETVEATPESSGIELDDYINLLVNQLELMASIEEWKVGQRGGRNSVARLRLSKEVVVDRVNGMKLKALMSKYGITTKATMNAILEDINTAFAAVAKKLNDPVLLRALTMPRKWHRAKT